MSDAGTASVEFVPWHNGGGILHRAASVDPTVVVEAGAVVHSGAVLGKEVVVGSAAVVGPSVSIGQSTRIGYADSWTQFEHHPCVPTFDLLRIKLVLKCVGTTLS